MGTIHRGDGGADDGDNLGESSDDLGEWSLSNDDQGGVDEGDAISWRLEVLRDDRDLLNAVGNLAGAERGHGRGSHDGTSSEDLGEEHLDDWLG